MRSLCLLTLLFILAPACAKVDETRNAVLEQIAQKALKAKLGEDAEATFSGNLVTISGKGNEYTISFGKNAGQGSKELPNNLPIFPGAALTGRIRGVNEDTIKMKTGASLSEIGKFYREVMPGRGFKNENHMEGKGQFSAIWVRPDSGLKVYLYSFATGAQSQIILIISHES